MPRYSENVQKTLRKAMSAIVPPKSNLNRGQVRQVKKIIDKEGETKHHTLIKAPTTIDVATPYNDCISLVSQGDNDSQRNGDKIKIKSINIRLRCYILGSSASDPRVTAFRFMVVQDKAYNTAQQVTLSDLTTAISVTSQRNVDHLKTLVVLYDKVVTLDLAGPSAKTFVIKPNLKYLKREIQYTASSAINQTGGLYLVIYNDSSTPNKPGFEFSSRITYTDK